MLTFGLAVCLRMKGSWESSFDAKEVDERWPEFRDEQWAFIRHDWIGEAMVLNYHVQDDFR